MVGQGQPKKAGMGEGERAQQTTPLLVVQLPGHGADPPPTSCGASARVPIPQGRPASSGQPKVITTDRPRPGYHCVPDTDPVRGHSPRPRCPYLAA